VVVRRLVPCALFLGLLLGVAFTAAAEIRVPPPPSRRVSDYAGGLPASDVERLERKLAQRERTSTNQVVVAIFRSLEGQSLEDYAIRLAQAWRVGQKGLDNGVIFLIFLDDRRLRLEVGYGLEGTLTDAVSSSILRDVVAPRFREGRVADGISAGLDAIDQAIAGTYARGSGRGRPSAGPSPLGLAVLAGLAVAGFAGIGMAMNARTQRRRGWTAGRQGWGPSRRDSAMWPFLGGLGGLGGGGGGGSGGGPDIGGFSGGGGSFGGGGASGEW
jgi:uncharacterized protein